MSTPTSSTQPLPEGYNVAAAIAFTGHALDTVQGEDIDYTTLCCTLGVLAKAGDEERFRTVTDAYVAALIGTNGDCTKDRRAEALSWLEFLCTGTDHGFAGLGLAMQDKRELPVGPAQALVQRLYHQASDA